MKAFEFLNTRSQCVYNICSLMYNGLINSAHETRRFAPAHNTRFLLNTSDTHVFPHTILQLHDMRTIVIVRNDSDVKGDTQIRIDLNWEQVSSSKGILIIPFPGRSQIINYSSKDVDSTHNVIDITSKTLEEELFQLSTVLDDNVYNLLLLSSILNHELTPSNKSENTSLTIRAFSDLFSKSESELKKLEDGIRRGLE